MASNLAQSSGLSYYEAEEVVLSRLSVPRNLTGGEWTPWKGGVFIHYEGGGSINTPSCEDCKYKIAEIWMDHYLGEFGDLAYNYVVCQHGTIYQGQGYQRGEANGGYPAGQNPADPTLPAQHIRVPTYGVVGRNAAFYSILGLISANDQPSSALRTTIRDLVYHLRSYSNPDRRAGNLLYPHQHGDATDCPGPLLPYTLDGSLDPGVVVVPGPQVSIIPRESWGARPPTDEYPVALSQRTGFTVHYSAGPPTQTVKQIQNFHMDGRGWPDIGYNFLVDRQGWIYEGVGWNHRGSHAVNYNTTHIGVCFIGSDGDATAAAKSSIRSLYYKASELCGRTLNATYHSGLPGASTACPGNDLRNWVLGGMDGEDIPIVVTPGTGSGGRSDIRSVVSQQWAVNLLGYTPRLVEDGVFGALTLAGVKWLQGVVGVEADGKWGPITESAYKAYVAGGGGGGRTDIRSVRGQQTAVNNLGYQPPLVVDGVFGAATAAGVSWLQQQLGLEADGLWGPMTEDAYRERSGETGWSGGANATIRSVVQQQTAVNRLGYSPALVVDGVFGQYTFNGVRWLQEQVGTLADGLWGPATESAYTAYLNGETLVVDGVFGTATKRALQRAVGVEADGVWGDGSKRATQRHLNLWADAGLVVDGVFGTGSVQAMQRHINTMTRAGLVTDGVWGAGTTRALQTALNQEKF
ncbi:N-acetylmuramoyl-L-alanine amidase [Streptomyces sp. NPDC059862]|uniref:peptidoglycan recognition protein family protein n=1 Tax=Streptomyces sp. NPDC059862 TaxID=3346975 RepID=UPI0036688ED9